MRCIFCKSDSGSSRSREHILPESLGNEDDALPAGVVCEKCNNYFARKLEHPLLASPMFRLLRADMRIANKRGRIPDFPTWNEPSLPPYRLMGRFIGKIAIEAMASRVLNVDGWNDELVDKPELDELRDFVRFNKGFDWPFWHRTLYPVNAVFREDGDYFEVLHEYKLLYTETWELYVAVAILGVEFVLNLGGPMLDGFKSWLERNGGASPLYHEPAAAQQAVAADGAGSGLK